ncbi:glycyl-radical enzyme activating protein [Anaerostipes sp.]|uniref:glycyl-radical enzyme activating protein n=1 Tax=Anaerostipes sp. TaxID=1872530 RepID=UPI0025C17EA9|nr:glycyl-radical enzyme activating protein [Anaerostipes sp.]MBS7007545.1 glycyl-radical enzyme activating protein [Anaerostipes sp.]
MKANIFNIQKFSIHDGPGIRTAVFFKGCPLHCRWCSNPESQSFHTQILWDPGKCLHCGLCQQSCPTGSIHFSDGGSFQFRHESCEGCLACTRHCPGNALEYMGKMMSVGEIMKEVLKDKDFYEESGGGITLSGGEVMAQPEFAALLLLECKNQGLHTALETTGYASHEVFVSVTEQADLLLFDMKHHDSKKHRLYTGVPNEKIIENMKWAVQHGKEVIARIPVIPEVNDSIEDAREFSALLRQIGITQVNLLPFHQFGQNKYEQLHMNYEMKDVDALHPEDLTEYAGIFEAEGLSVKF